MYAIYIVLDENYEQDTQVGEIRSKKLKRPIPIVLSDEYLRINNYRDLMVGPMDSDIAITLVIGLPRFAFINALTNSGRRSHACSVEPPHPTEPPNAVKRSRRKYHSGVTRDWLFRCQGKELLLPLTYNGQKNGKFRWRVQGKKIIYYLMV